MLDLLDSNLEKLNLSGTNYRLWCYKDKCVVLDINIDGKKFAYDFSLSNNKLNVDLIFRNFKNKSKHVLLENYETNDLSFLEVINSSILDQKKPIFAVNEFEITVIVPVYNREKLIGGCINSLNNQTLDNSKFEVLFVDDFSSDNTITKIQQLVDSSLNYRILKRPINSGAASSPRNDGIKSAKGRYIYFLDSDDFIYDYALQDLLDCAEKNNSDLIYVKIQGDKGRTFGIRPFSKGDVDKASIHHNHLVRSLMPIKLMKRHILLDHNIYFPLDIKVGEDRIFMMHVLAKVKRISILGDKPYYYVTNHDGERMTNAEQSLHQDYEIVSRCFKHIFFSNKKQDKVHFFSSFMNVVLESYIRNRIRSNKHSEKEKKEYIDLIYRDFNFYKELHSDQFVYQQFKDIYKFFVNKDYDNLVRVCS